MYTSAVFQLYICNLKTCKFSLIQKDSFLSVNEKYFETKFYLIYSVKFKILMSTHKHDIISFLSYKMKFNFKLFGGS